MDGKRFVFLRRPKTRRTARFGRAFVVLAMAVSAAAGADLQDTVVSVPLGEGHDTIAAGIRLGSEEGRVLIAVKLDDGKKHVFRARVEPDSLRTRAVVGGKSVWKQQKLPDAVIGLAGLVRYHSRPRLGRYTTKQQEGLIKRWAALPAASQRLVTFEARQDAPGVALYLDGHYVGRRDAPGRMASLELTRSDEAQVRDVRSYASYRHEKHLPLSLRPIARPGAMRASAVSIPPGLRTVGGVPMIVAGGADSVDVGVVKEMKGSWALECDEHLSRTALDGMPETAHFSVPPAPYVRAWALCAVADEADRDPVLTARLTRFARSGRGGAISDTTVELPRGDAAPSAGVTKVGTVRYGKSGRKVTVPLLLVEFRLKLGEILDLLAMEQDPTASMTRQPYLDFEFLGKLDGLSAQWDRRHKPDRKSTSAVHVFGATLERGPVGVRVETGQPGNIFHDDEKPEMFVTATATRKCGVALGWRVYGADGKTIRRDGREMRFAKAGETKRIAIPLNAGGPGWYGIDLTVHDGRLEVLRHEAAFALLGRNTRKAGYESPYGTWWFSGAHYGAGDKEIAGPMLFKAGLRKTTFGWSKYSEADMAPWKITLNQISWRYAPRDLANPKKAYDEAAAKVRELRKRFPHCRSADIFHESYSHYVPAELRDEKPAEDAKAVESGRQRAELGNFAARFYRERFPEIKLLVGNTSSSGSIIASLLRHGFDAKYIDSIGVEAVGQTGMPEKLWEGSTQGIWLAREAARKLGHDLPVTGCYEFTARIVRNLGPRRHAEWIARDMLLCHAYRFRHINPAILHDAGNAYFNTLWGAGGLCQRNPLLYPKPAYVAVATLTKVLDRVTPLRRVPTGSTTVYALEFRRADGQFAYALWTARGRAGLRLRFPRAADVTRVGCYGATTRASAGPPDHEVDVVCGTAPVYVVGPVRVASIEIVRRELAGAPASFRVADAMNDPSRWALAPGDERLRNPTRRGLPYRVPGRFDLAAVADGEKGRCLELKLRRKGKVPEIVGEYTALKLARPVAVPGKPTDVGLWVRGDSGWGKIIFEIADAAGTGWRTDGVWHDWPGDLSICHDGWRFMSFPIDGSSGVRNISPGRRWVRSSAAKSRTIQFPIKLTGLSVVMYRKALDLSDMKAVCGVLGFRDLGTFSQDPATPSP